MDRLALSSTPLKNGVNTSHPDVSLAGASPVTPARGHERCDTPRLSHRGSRSQEKACLGDFLAAARSSKKKRSSNRNASDDGDVAADLDLSSSDMFPEIGARKSSSLRSEKRRIKPTNIDQSKKSLSLNSFNSEYFQQPSPLALEDNVAFKQQKLQPMELSRSFEAERNILKQERHKLMEKFNTLNSSASPKTPQIKVNQRESLEKSQNYIEADAARVVYRDKLDVLADIYDSLLKNNLVLSINTEIYFLISIILSKQKEEDYAEVASKLNEASLQCHILRTIHNSTYFAVRCLWLQRGLLELILDKNSLKLLGENKKVRGFCAELAKCLLNWYGVRCEQGDAGPPPSPGPPRGSQGAGVVAFNVETDCADNFPSTLSFHNFKKQRDMFYEIVRSVLDLLAFNVSSMSLAPAKRWRASVDVRTVTGTTPRRWYNDSSVPAGAPRGGLRPRLKALVAAGPAPANLAHLAALLSGHLLAHCQHSQVPRPTGARRNWSALRPSVLPSFCKVSTVVVLTLFHENI